MGSPEWGLRSPSLDHAEAPLYQAGASTWPCDSVHIPEGPYPNAADSLNPTWSAHPTAWPSLEVLVLRQLQIPGTLE